MPSLGTINSRAIGKEVSETDEKKSYYLSGTEN